MSEKNVFFKNINKYYKEKKEKINKIFDLKQQLKYTTTIYSRQSKKELKLMIQLS